MNLIRIVLWSRFSCERGSYAVAAIWLPLAIIVLVKGWATHDIVQDLIWLAITIAGGSISPFIVIGRLNHLRLSRLWVIPILLPTVSILLFACMHWETGVNASMLASFAVQIPFILLSTPKIL